MKGSDGDSERGDGESGWAIRKATRRARPPGRCSLPFAALPEPNLRKRASLGDHLIRGRNLRPEPSELGRWLLWRLFCRLLSSLVGGEPSLARYACTLCRPVERHVWQLPHISLRI